ncbi:MAG: NAD-dependent epimerase/dehydratase family protein [Candidatus Cloacimonetes bacterium]|nr:NAD-dependent epimerase/dehydratase family protein [Candidatus Cloacimonadota bacterium]
MKLLILGGTIFLGRHLAEHALIRGWDVTLFHRGKHYPEILPRALKLIGDRDGNLDALAHGEWDAVIDTSGYFPRLVRASVELLQQRVGLYVFISSISVYKDYATCNLDETYPLTTLEGESSEKITGETYGALKALCERVVTQYFPNRNLIVRPGLIVGPYDISDRYTYWVRRIRNGGQILAPGKPEYPVQFIDVRDLANWILDMTEQQRIGTYNATGPGSFLTMNELLHKLRLALQSDCEFIWVNDDFLVKQGVGAYSELPLWVPLEGNSRYFSEVSAEKAIKAGLTFRSLEESAVNVLKWRDTIDFPLRSGMNQKREKELLNLWSPKKSNIFLSFQYKCLAELAI